MSKPPLAILAALIVVGCSGGGSSAYVPSPPPKIEPATVKPGQEQELFPFKVGNSWTFAAQTAQRVGGQTRQQSSDATFKVVKVETINGNKQATIDLVVSDKVVDRQVWYSNSKGIYQVNLGMKGERKFTTPIPAILFPVEPNKKFSWEGGDGKAKMAYNSMIIGAQEVDTDEKRMSAIAIESKGTSVVGKETEKTDRTIWFAPGIGIVRISEATTSTKGSSALQLSLKSHTVK